jgi:hypothetical protein
MGDGIAQRHNSYIVGLFQTSTGSPMTETLAQTYIEIFFYRSMRFMIL